MYFSYVILNSERNKLRSLRKYHKKDKKELRFFIAFITCVVWFSFSSFKLQCFTRVLDILHTIFCVYMNYWWDGHAHAVFRGLTIVGTWSVILVMSKFERQDMVSQPTSRQLGRF